MAVLGWVLGEFEFENRDRDIQLQGCSDVKVVDDWPKLMANRLDDESVGGWLVK